MPVQVTRKIFAIVALTSASWIKENKVNNKVQLTVHLSQERLDRWEALAKCRYGDNSQESLDKVAEDAFKWLMGKWEKGYYSFYDWFWSKVVFCPFCPFKRLVAIGWAKLVFERYLSN